MISATCSEVVAGIAVAGLRGRFLDDWERVRLREYEKIIEK
jgi:hypothetical protein